MTLPTPTVSPFYVPAPWAWLHPRTKSTLAGRIGAVCEYVLSKQQIPVIPFRPKSSLHYVSMVGRKHWLLLRESLLSLCFAWTHVPRLSVISDGTWEEREFRQYFNWWPGSLRVWSPQQTLKLLPKSITPELHRLAEAHPLGLKLAGILALGTEGPLLFVDSDVLWFSDPWANQEKRTLDFVIASGIDPECSYNPALVESVQPTLNTPPFTNSGCVWLQMNELDADFLKKTLVASQVNPHHEFNEQTIIAALIRNQGRFLPAEFFLVKFDDQHNISPTQTLRNPPHSRHYVRFMRHLFYRDAVLLRLNFALTRTDSRSDIQAK